MHYSGGLIYHDRQGHTTMLAGWPCCCHGDRAADIAASGWQSADPSVVTCRRCLVQLRKAGEL